MSARPSYAAISQHASFRHERLKLSENSIRLFQVQRGSKDEPISLRMTQYSHLRRPKYKAISYTWGSSDNTHQILVNGQFFRIHRNLWTLLHHLRLRNETSFLWADALCIDQLNLRERNFHVQLMGRIYDEAVSVLVWLGLPSPDRTEIRAMDFIKEVSMMRKSHSTTALAEIYLATDVQHRWETLLRMCQHTYWTRTWIVQEFAQASGVEVMCGLSTLNWEDFEDLVSLVHQEAAWTSQPVIQRLVQTRATRLTMRRRAGTRSNLYDLLREYHDSECTERRDKVYGMIGLAHDCSEDIETGEVRGVRPDYKKHIVEVYMDSMLCVRDSLPSTGFMPSVALLLRKTLLITKNDFVDYITDLQTPETNNLAALTTFGVIPDYVGTVQKVLPGLTSTRDIKQRLEAIDWGEYLGYHILPRQSNALRRTSSRSIYSTIPDDLISNMMTAADILAKLSYLYNYPNNGAFTIPTEHMTLHAEDKRQYRNESLQKPSIIIEQNDVKECVRLGFACTDVQKGDLIFQFRGLDLALIGRQIDHNIIIVGKAVMIKHSGIQHEDVLDPVCEGSDLVSHTWHVNNTGDIEVETDAISILELLSSS